MAASIAAARTRRPSSFGWLRRSSDIWLSFAMGGVVALLMMTLPTQAALASSVVGAFVLIALVDTRVALLGLLLVRSAVDVTATVPLLSASGSSDVNANALMSLLVIALGLTHIALNRVDVRRIPLVTPFAAIVAITFLGIAVAPDHNRALQDWLRIAGTLILYILVVDTMRTREDRRWLVRIILLSALVPLAAGLYQLVTDTGNQETSGFNRIMGTFVYPSPYAFYLVQLLPLAAVFFLHTKDRFARIGLGVMLPVMVLSIYATQTRGAWLGVITMVIVLMAMRARWTLLLVPLMFGAMLFALPSVRARINEARSGQCVSATNCQSSVLWRTKQWQEALSIPSKPMLVTVGAGLGAVDVVSGNFTHNEYVRLLVEAGLLGLVATVVLYKKLFDITLKGHREATDQYRKDLMLAFMLALLSRIVIAASDNILVLVVIEWYFWAFAAIVVVESGAYDRLGHSTDGARLAPAAAPEHRPALPAPGEATA